MPLDYVAPVLGNSYPPGPWRELSAFTYKSGFIACSASNR
jgi:hypothetical protein